MTSIPTNDATAGRSTFVTTQWTQILEARGDSPAAKAALGELCAAYYAPVLAYIRHNSTDEERARDLAQEFFARLLARNGIEGVDPERGPFRSYLLGAVKHFLSDVREHDHRLKRGGGQVPQALEAETDTRVRYADANTPAPDREFDRKWALTVLDHALNLLSQEHAAAGKQEVFEILKPWLTGDTENLSQADAAARLGINEGAVKVAIHRLRRRFREMIKSEIARTLRADASVEDELKHLREALA